MAYLSTRGLDELMKDIGTLGEMPETVAEDILNAQADIVIEEQKRTGKAMGVYRTGKMLDSLTKTKVYHMKNGNSALKVQFEGKHSRTSTNSEVAFINEYGKTNQPARPFIRTANEKSDAATIKAAMDVYDKYLKTKNL